MSKKLMYMVVDTETATLPLVGELCHSADEKKKLAIAKPLVYDIGWTICDRQGTIYRTQQFLIAETFSVPAIFNTAYYADKRPIYLQMLAEGKTTIKPWREAMEIFMADLEQVDAVGAFNSMFDFKKAIPFTELYINKLYSPSYYEWENYQRAACRFILNNPPRKEKSDDFEADLFRFRGNEYQLFDLWGLATRHLLNNSSYKNQCLKHNNLTASGIYFKTSAETSYQYLCDKYDFVESHTALDDAMIETYILGKIAKRHAINPGIIFFPFRELGYTYDYVTTGRISKKNCQTVYDAIYDYCSEKTNGFDNEPSGYVNGLMNKLAMLREILEA